MTDEQLNKFQRCIKVFANSVAALSEIEMMKVANEERRRNDYADAYDEAAFASITLKYSLDVDDTQQYLFQ